MVTEEDRRKFEEDGYFILPSLITAEEAREYRIKMNAVLGLPEVEFTSDEIDRGYYGLADGVTITPAFWPLIFNERLLDTVRDLLGGDIRYTQHSDLHINLGGGRYHRDNCCREFSVGPDWDEREEPYKVVRIAIYLSDFYNSGTSIVLLPDTHRHESKINRMEYILWNKLRSFMRNKGFNNKLPHLFFSKKCIRYKTNPGDCLIFDQRLMHAGGNLHSRYPKYAVFLAYGIDNHHSRNHRKFFLGRPTYNSEIPSELKKRLELHGLYLN